MDPDLVCAWVPLLIARDRLGGMPILVGALQGVPRERRRAFRRRAIAANAVELIRRGVRTFVARL